VGAFAAGLVLEERHSAAFVARGERSLEELLQPLSSFLVPIFFVVMGLRADLRVLVGTDTFALLTALLVAAVAGKAVCALGAARGADRTVVALGMMPRGEVTLIFASLGLTLVSGGAPLLDRRAYSALVAVVVATTLLTPTLLERRLRRAALS
jgi:Kef-type K+ transport system membrane component KefB